METTARTVKFFRCDCGKLHTATLVGSATKCTCGKNLRELINWVNSSPMVCTKR
jgi:hypothetical protein